MREGPRRLLWFAALWLGSLLAFAGLAWGLRWLFLALGNAGALTGQAGS